MIKTTLHTQKQDVQLSIESAGPTERIFKCVSVSQLRGSGDMLPRENLKLKSSEMARNGSKTAKSEVNF